MSFEAILGVLDGARLAPRHLCASATPRYTWQTMGRHLNCSTTSSRKENGWLESSHGTMAPRTASNCGVNLDLRVSERPVARVCHVSKRKATEAIGTPIHPEVHGQSPKLVLPSNKEMPPSSPKGTSFQLRVHVFHVMHYKCRRIVYGTCKARRNETFQMQRHHCLSITVNKPAI